MRGVVRVPWTDAERAKLRRLHDNGLSQPQIAALLGRTKNSVHRQLANLGLVPSDRPGAHPKVARPRSPKTTLPPLPSLSMRGDGECAADDQPWDGTGWPRGEDFWP
jgi:hypothetical protein